MNGIVGPAMGGTDRAVSHDWTGVQPGPGPARGQPHFPRDSRGTRAAYACIAPRDRRCFVHALTGNLDERVSFLEDVSRVTSASVRKNAKQLQLLRNEVARLRKTASSK